jgi:hypothetical protein
MKQSVAAADSKQSVSGKKSFGKMSALQALTFDSDEEDMGEEQRRLRERIKAMKNQI